MKPSPGDTPAVSEDIESAIEAFGAAKWEQGRHGTDATIGEKIEQTADGLRAAIERRTISPREANALLPLVLNKAWTKKGERLYTKLNRLSRLGSNDAR